MQTPLLTARGLGVRVTSGNFLFESLSFSLNPGEVLWVKGPGGSGKTTLLRLIGGTQLAHAGDVESVLEPEEIGFVPEPDQLPIFSRATFLDLIDGEIGNRAQAGASYVMGVLEKHHLPLFWGEATREQRRRLLVTLALMRQPRLLILDEPFADLSAEVARDLGQSLAIHLLEKRPEALVVVSESPLHALADCGVPIRAVELGEKLSYTSG